ncbi:MAG: sulfotransferase [Acidimicrobiia bacterium]|nr:sulfotransferase [Acidimicrobiia bacterium]
MTLDPDAPIVVGALGGSGTRVLGQLLLALDVHIGDHRNHAEDSLTASLLFNRPGDLGDRAERVRRFEQIGRLLRGDADRHDRLAVVRAVGGIEHPPLRYRLQYATGAVRERGAPERARGWGFKEPNTHLFLDELAEAFARLRFVYVMRHPLDMAFTANLQQLHNWAPHFDVTVPDDPAAVPAAQLDLWLAATHRATTRGPELLGERFLALDYEQLLVDPDGGVDGLCRFVGIEPADPTTLVALVRTPDTSGRFRHEDLSVFRPDQLDAVLAAGFPI